MQYWNDATKNRAKDALAQSVDRKALSLAVAGPGAHTSVAIFVERLWCIWIHSSVVGAADCRSAGPWFKSGCALLAAIAAAQARAVALEHQEHHQQQRFIFFIFCSYCSVVNVSYVVCV